MIVSKEHLHDQMNVVNHSSRTGEKVHQKDGVNVDSSKISAKLCYVSCFVHIPTSGITLDIIADVYPRHSDVSILMVFENEKRATPIT